MEDTCEPCEFEPGVAEEFASPPDNLLRKEEVRRCVEFEKVGRENKFENEDERDTHLTTQMVECRSPISASKILSLMAGLRPSKTCQDTY